MQKPVATNQLLLRVNEAAELLGISRSSAHAAISRGELPVIRLGRTSRVPRLWLERWIAEGANGAVGSSQWALMHRENARCKPGWGVRKYVFCSYCSTNKA